MGLPIDGPGDLLHQVRNWSKDDWFEHFGQIATQCPIGGQARLFWTITNSRSIDLQAYLLRYLSSIEMECTDTQKVIFLILNMIKDSPVTPVQDSEARCHRSSYSYSETELHL